MKNGKRMLAMASMTLAAGALLGITPAQAAPAAVQSPGTAAANSSGPYWDWNDDYAVGYFEEQWECNKAGWWGRKHGAWGDYYCFPAWVPGWGNVWVLQVEENDWNWNSWNGGWPGGWPYKPDYLVGKSFKIGGPYTHPFKYKKNIKYGNLNGVPFNPYQKYNGPKNYYNNSGKFNPPYGGGSGNDYEPPYGGGSGNDYEPPYGGGSGNDNEPPYGGGSGNDNEPPYGGGSGNDNEPPYGGGSDNESPYGNSASTKLPPKQAQDKVKLPDLGQKTGAPGKLPFKVPGLPS